MDPHFAEAAARAAPDPHFAEAAARDVMSRSRSKRAARGFSLLELMVATTIAVVVVAAATSAILVIIRALNQSGQSSAADAESQIVTEYLVSQLQAVGGGAVRPWMVVVIGNNSGAGGSDVVTFADIPVDLPSSLTISRRLGERGPGFYSFFVPTGTDGLGRLVGRCPLAELRKDTDGDGFPQPVAEAAAAYTTAELRGLQVILTGPTGETWRSVVLTQVGFTASFDGCFAQFHSTGSDATAALVANGEFKNADRFSGNTAGVTEDPDEWVLGQMSFVRARQWRYEPAVGADAALVRGRIVERMTPTRGEGGFGDDRVLLEGVLDLQVSPGYDFNPFNGVVAETADGRADEWLNSAPLETTGPFNELPRDLATPDPPIAPDTLRMLDIAVVIALPRAERTLTVRAADGAERTGPEARVAGGRAYLRNQLLFL